MKKRKADRRSTSQGKERAPAERTTTPDREANASDRPSPTALASATATPRETSNATPIASFDRWLAAAFLALVFWLGCYDIVDGDFPWHLRTGELIWQRGEIPATDWYTYSNPERRWINLHWLFQLGVFGVWSAGGTALVILVKSAVGASIFAILWFAVPRTQSTWLAVAIWIPPLVVFSGRYDVRPEMLSLLCLATFLVVLSTARERPVRLWLLPIVQLMWVNVQGLFVLGPLVLLLAWIGMGLDRLTLPLTARDRPPLPWRTLMLVSLAVLLACCVNPYGLEGVTFPVILQARIQGPERPFYQQLSGEFLGLGEFIAEHGPVAVLTNISTLTLVVTAAIGLASFAATLRRGRGSWFRIGVFVAFGYLAWQASRNSVLFAVVAAWATAWNLSELDPDAPLLRLAPDRAQRMRYAVAALLAILAIAAPLGILAAARGMGALSEMPRRFGLGMADWFPRAAVAFLGRDGMPRCCYANHLGMASQYIAQLGPERRVFADPRLEVNSPEVLADYLAFPQRLAAGDPAADRLILRGIPRGPDGTQPRPALLFNIYTLAHWPQLVTALETHPHWRCVYVDDQAAVYLWDDVATTLKLPRIRLLEPAEGK